MRLQNAAVLAAAALLVASVVSAQGLGDAAAREKARKTTKPTKVYTESDLGGASSVESAAGAEAPATDAATAAAGSGAPAATGAEGQAADAKAKPKTDAEIEADLEKERQKAIEEWRAKLDDARKQAQQYQELVDRMQLDLNDTSGLYAPSRAQKLERFEDAKKKLAEAQTRVSDLEDLGRRSNYR